MTKLKPKTTKFDQILGANLHLIRLKNSLSAANVSKNLNISQQQIYKYETGKNRIPILKYLQLCKIYNIDPASFLKTEVDYEY